MRYAISTKTNKLIDSKSYNESFNDDFSCPNLNCGAKLSFIKANGSRTSFFRSKPSNPHIPMCDYYYNGGGNNLYSEDGFDIVKSLHYLISYKISPITNNLPKNKCITKNNLRLTVPKTIKAIYSALMCNINDTFAGCNVNDILCCEETRNIHNELNGILLVKAKFGFNTQKLNTLGLFYPCTYSNNQIKLEIEFQNDEFYNNFFNSAKNNKQFPILIFAEFSQNKCKVNNKTQIVILNNQR